MRLRITGARRWFLVAGAARSCVVVCGVDGGGLGSVLVIVRSGGHKVSGNEEYLRVNVSKLDNSEPLRGSVQFSKFIMIFAKSISASTQIMPNVG